jgi:molybdate transport system substrate-binding protein
MADFIRIIAVAALLTGLPSPLAAQAPAPQAPPQPQPSITALTAPSLSYALSDLNIAFARTGKIQVSVAFGTGAGAMRQIETDPRPDVLIFDSAAAMDEAAQKKLIQPASRFNLLGNKLVLIAPKATALAPVTIGPGLDLIALAGTGPVMLADPQRAAVGQYAKAALEKLGAWTAIEGKVTTTEDEREVLAAVARGTSALGIAYETDARAEPEVKILGTFPADTHPPIIYPAALAVGAKPEAARYLAYLKSATALVLFERHGFTYLVKAGP